MAYKPILFNTEMVKAILAGLKTQTRRLIKDFAGEEIKSILKPDGSYGKYGTKGWRGMLPDRGDGNEYCIEVRPPCEPGDILWVRETWAKMPYGFVYRADDEKPEYWDFYDRWHPSIHMPKEAARIFLRVKDVRVERIQSITDADAHSEGVPEIGDYPIKPVYCPRCKGEGLIGGHSGHGYVEVDCPDCRTNVQRFSHLWDSTIKPADLDKYGWNADPWVWVIEFEPCEKPEGWPDV